MAQNIPVPAEVVRQMAIEASDEIDAARERGHRHTAESLEKHISTAFAALDGKDGEYVSIDGSAVAALASRSTTEVPKYTRAATVYLEKYGIW